MYMYTWCYSFTMWGMRVGPQTPLANPTDRRFIMNRTYRILRARYKVELIWSRCIKSAPSNPLLIEACVYICHLQQCMSIYIPSDSMVRSGSCVRTPLGPKSSFTDKCQMVIRYICACQKRLLNGRWLESCKGLRVDDNFVSDSCGIVIIVLLLDFLYSCSL